MGVFLYLSTVDDIARDSIVLLYHRFPGTGPAEAAEAPGSASVTPPTERIPVVNYMYVRKPCSLDKSTSSDAQAVHGVPTGCADEKTIVSGGHVIDLGLRRLFCSVELFFVGRWCV